jgi:ferric-dicitrate binding protein FerR (iron transport regulator)
MEKLNQLPENIQILIVSFLEGSVNEEGIEALNRWMLEKEDNLLAFDTIKRAWVLSGKNINVDDTKTNSAFEKIQKEAFEPGKSNSMFRKIVWMAASWIIIFAVGGILGKYISRDKQDSNEQSKITSISAPLGSRSQVNLPDGTKVWLNAGSNISYNGNFGKSNRLINLSGEAYFDVKRNEKIPFYIKTLKNITVKVLGTAFNVKAYPEENYVETTVERGKVQVSKFQPESKKTNTITLLPKQKLKIEYNQQTLTDSNLSKNEENSDTEEKKETLQSNVETKVYTSWKDGEWIIDSEPLEYIAVIIERSYNVDIEFKDPELKKYVFTGILKDETLEQVLELIKLTAPIKYRIDKRTVELTKNKLIQ